MDVIGCKRPCESLYEMHPTAVRRKWRNGLFPLQNIRGAFRHKNGVEPWYNTASCDFLSQEAFFFGGIYDKENNGGCGVDKKT